jgi:hypothetical protein
LSFAIIGLASAATIISKDSELRDLETKGWDCLDRVEGTAKTQDGIELNRMKNRWAVESLRVHGRAAGYCDILKKGS